jgi:hypothetical protein
VSESSSVRERYWPALPVEGWLDTINTLHMWTQIVGKIRLAQSLMAFLESTYEAAATAARWDRKTLEQTFVP